MANDTDNGLREGRCSAEAHNLGGVVQLHVPQPSSDQDTADVLHPARCRSRDLGTFRATDHLPREIRECVDAGHVMEAREFPGTFLHFCRACKIRYQVLIEDDEQ